MKRINNPLATVVAVGFLLFMTYLLFKHAIPGRVEFYWDAMVNSFRHPLDNMNVPFIMVGGILIVCAIAVIFEQFSASAADNATTAVQPAAASTQPVFNIVVNPTATPAEQVMVQRDTTPHVATINTPVPVTVSESTNSKTLA